jgi:hypothetical protein
MAQIQKGYEYDSTDPVKNVVTDDNLNALVGNATLLNGAITEQASNSVTADTDIMLLSKGGTLIKQTKGQFTNTINANTINVNTLDVASVVADDIDTVDATLTGNLSVGGNAAITGGLAVTGNTTANGNLTVNGTTNVTGAFQVDGSAVSLLYEIYEESMTPWSAPANGSHWGVFASSVFTKPAGEIWVFEVAFNYKAYIGYGSIEFAGRYGSVAQGTGPYIFHDHFFDSQGGGNFYRNSFLYRWTAVSATTFTNETFKIDGFNGGAGLQLFHTTTGHTLSSSVVASKFRIYKYKNA